MPTARGRTYVQHRRSATAGILIVLVAMLAALSVGASAAPPEGEEEAANNLSTPVVWSDGVKLTVPGVFGTETWAGDTMTVDGVTYWLQGDPDNSWQAESLDATDAATAIDGVDVTEVDWGDNLEAKSWPAGNQIRVETVLFQDVLNDPEFVAVDLDGDGMLAYTMASLGGQHRYEIFGTDKSTFLSPEATVYSGDARLTIQRLAVSRDDPAADPANGIVKWDAATSRWVGENVVEPPSFNGGVWEGGEGSGYSAEINVSGKVIYGYNWQSPPVDGHYRLTFSLDAVNGPVALNTAITSATTIAVSDEGEEMVEALAEPDMGGGIAKIDGTNGLSYIDVQLGDPVYGPYVPQSVTPPATQPSPPSPPAAPDATPQQARKHVRMTLHVKRLSQTRVRFWGSVWPRHDGVRVRIQRRVDNRYRTVATAKLRRANATRSEFRRTLRHMKAGRYRVRMDGDHEHLATTTKTVRLRLR